MGQATLDRVRLRGAEQPDSGRVLTPEALEFLRDLHDRFDARRRTLLREREQRAERIRRGE